MPVELEIQQIVVPAKLELPEVLWDGLFHHGDEVPSPAWHEEILKERRSGIESGTDTLTDWHTAKAKILAQVS